MSQDVEVWLPMVNFEQQYEVSSMGRVRRIDNGVLKLFHSDQDGYLVCNMGKLNKKYKKRVHALVAEAFIQNPLSKPTVNHKNGIKTDNTVGNLEWMTIKENIQHAYANGLYKTKLNEDDVAFIRKNIYTLGTDELCRKFSIAPTTVTSIATGRTRKECQQPPLTNNLRSRTILDFNTGVFYEQPKELATLLGVAPRWLHRRLNGERPNNTPYRYV